MQMLAAQYVMRHKSAKLKPNCFVSISAIDEPWSWTSTLHLQLDNFISNPLRAKICQYSNTYGPKCMRDHSEIYNLTCSCT